MATQIYTFKITYADCDNRIWRIAAVSSNYTLARLGYLVLASFDTMAYHQFEMKYQDTVYSMFEDDCGYDEDLKSGLLGLCKLGSLRMQIGDTIEMIYDFGCEQRFEISLLEIGEMPKGRGNAYPKILDGAGRGIVDDMPSDDLLEAIRKTDADGHSEIFYSSSGSQNAPEWDYRKYSLDLDNILLRGLIDSIRYGYESEEE